MDVYYSTADDFTVPENFSPEYDSFALALRGEPFIPEKTPKDRAQERKARRLRKAIDHAKEVIRDMLSAGPVTEKEAWKRWKREGIHDKIWNAARKELGVKITGIRGKRIWSL